MILVLSAASPAAASLRVGAVRLAPLERERALDCLALAIVHEAGQEPRAGQEAVAEVILNRLDDPAYPKTVCEIVFAGADRSTGCQFSFTCDGALRRAVPPARLMAARLVAAGVLDGTALPHVPGATHYHASYVAPRWAPGLVRIAGIGLHIFYRRAGGPAVAVTPAPVAGPPAAAFAPWGLGGAS